MAHPLQEGRPARLPLFVQVVTQPAIHDCWTVDISATGIGLIADRAAGGQLPAEGEVLELEFALPDSGSTVRARAEVRWRHESPGPVAGEVGLAMGLQFTWMPGADRAELARYLQDHRFHVGVAFAVGDERVLVEQSLGERTRLHFADSVAALREVVERGDIAAVIACGDDGRLLDAVVAHTHGSERHQGWHDAGTGRDLAPRIIHFGRVSPEQLVRYFNEGEIFRSLDPPVAPAELRRTVLQACGEYGVRTEQHRLALSLERALLQERARTRPEAQLRRVVADRMIHASEEMAQTLSLVRTVAPHRLAVLLQGETGTGKEILARTIHDLSDRANASFVIQDCGALPETLLESELFGHVKGAFTGAEADHPGLFVLADGGTIFLDEIENTTPSLQAKLLRVIETGAVRPVGGTKVRHVDVRVVAAGNRDLRAEAAAGRFRPDLFYRLSTFIIEVPPLRRRPADVRALAAHFLAQANRSLGRSAEGITAEAEAALLSYGWPGNVRELRNVIERAVLLSRPETSIGLAELPTELSARPGEKRARSQGGSLKARLAEVERRAIGEALGRNGGVLRRAAKDLGVSAVTLGRKVRQHGLEADLRASGGTRDLG